MLDENVPVEELMKMIPAQRMGTPEEVAGAVNFLMSAEAGYGRATGHAHAPVLDRIVAQQAGVFERLLRRPYRQPGNPAFVVHHFSGWWRTAHRTPWLR